jgi:acyl-CoA thioester hydrolase
LPIHHKIVFHSEIFNEQGELINIGDVTLYFMEVNEMKKSQMPTALRVKLEKYF